MDELYWALHYANGEVLGEHEILQGGASIRLAEKGAVELALMQADRPVALVALVSDGHAWRPIFYRVRGIQGGSAAFTVSVILGRAREDDTGITAQLWATVDRQIVPCPEPLLDRLAVQMQMDAAENIPVLTA